MCREQAQRSQHTCQGQADSCLRREVDPLRDGKVNPARSRSRTGTSRCAECAECAFYAHGRLRVETKTHVCGTGLGERPVDSSRGVSDRGHTGQPSTACTLGFGVYDPHLGAKGALVWLP